MTRNQDFLVICPRKLLCDAEVVRLWGGLDRLDSFRVASLFRMSAFEVSVAADTVVCIISCVYFGAGRSALILTVL